MTRLIGLDIGDRRTGIAVSDEVGITARPYSTVPTVQVGEALKRLMAEQGVGIIVVGRPRHLDGSLGEQAGKIDAIVEQLRLAAPAKYVYEDETATTAAAEEQAGGTPARRSLGAGRDADAARVMLQGYLDEHAR